MTKQGIMEMLDDAYDLISKAYQEILDEDLRKEITLILSKMESLHIELRKENRK